MNAAKAPPACLSCGAPHPRDAASIRGRQLWCCQTCDLVFHEVSRSDEAHAALFDSTYFLGSEPDGYVDYLASESALRRQARTYLRWIERATGTPGRLFDAGCAAGFLLDEARSGGWAVSGCDPSKWASQHAREALALDVATVAFEHASTPHLVEESAGSLDALTFVNVLEHLTRPGVAIQHAESMLRSGGVLLVETWDRDSLLARVAGARWHQWSPEHVTSWFNRRSLRALVSPSRWEWMHFGAVTRWISISRALEVLGGRLASPFGDLLVPYRLGDLVVLLARKR